MRRKVLSPVIGTAVAALVAGGSPAAAERDTTAVGDLVLFVHGYDEDTSTGQELCRHLGKLAIAINAAHPEIAAELGVEVGGAGTGSHNSLAQYIANQLSTRIKQDGDTFPVEGAFLSNDHVSTLSFVGPDGVKRTSSLTDSGYDLSLYRLRATVA